MISEMPIHAWNHKSIAFLIAANLTHQTMKSRDYFHTTHWLCNESQQKIY